MIKGLQCGMRKAAAIELTEQERGTLLALSRGKKVSVRLAQRSAIILLAADGQENIAIAASLKITRQRAARWRDRYAAQGLAGIATDAPRSGRIPKISSASKQQVVKRTLEEKPPAATHWSRSTMASASGLSDSTVGRIWKTHGLKPHLSRTFKLSNDKHFAEKLEAIVGLYLNPPEHAVVFSCDEKSQIQALDRTQPGLPLKKGRAATMTHDYKCNGTTSLFAALNIATGKVIGTCLKQHRHQEWIRFLNLVKAAAPAARQVHVICDNYATHKHAKVQVWQKRNPHFHFHFTPTSASWLNMVERFFRDLTTNRIRRGVFHSEADLIAAIDEYLAVHNANPKPLIWTARATDILEKVKRARARLDKLRSV
jgi:transposase